MTKRSNKLAYLLLAPSLLLLIAILIYPMGFSLSYSFQFWNLQTSPTPQGFAGIQNFSRVFSDPQFVRSLINTLYISVTATVLQLVLGLMIANLLNAKLKGTGVARVLLILPVAISPMVVGFIFRYLLYANGLLPFIFRSMGISLPARGLLGSNLTAPWMIILTDTWQWTPFFAIILLAGLKSIPLEIIEAAKVDGASPFQAFWYVKLPSLKFVLAIVIMIRFLKTFNLFDIIHIMTRGGPGMATRTLSYNLFYAALRYFNVGYSSAMAWVMILIVIVIINGFIFIIFPKREF